MRIGFGDDFRMIDFELRKFEGDRGESHCHAMILVGVDGFVGRIASLAIPNQGVVILVFDYVAHLL